MTSSTSVLWSVRKAGGRIARALLPRRAYDFLRFRVFHAVRGRLKGARPMVVGDPALASRLARVNANVPTSLCWTMKTSGSDKGLAWHNYTTVYSELFSGARGTPARVFELGIGTNNPDLPSTMDVGGTPGASLRGWARFFPQGRVFGADIDRAILFREGRIETFYCDQLDPAAIAEMWAQPALAEPMDVLIEDGLHTFEANTTFLENSIHKVAPNGHYVVEDIPAADLPRWEAKIAREYPERFPDFAFAVVRLPWHYNQTDNNLIVAWRRGRAGRGSAAA